MSGTLSQTYMVNTYDIETYEENTKVIPYCICFIINDKQYSLYDNDYDNLVIESLNIICNKNKENFIEIYIHNINFDALLIINEITQNNIIYNMKTVDTNIYYLDIFYVNKIIRFRCSYKLIPLSLSKIGIIENFKKLVFPYKFVSKLTLSYIGDIPSKKYWEKNDYDIFLKSEIKIFNLKEETIIYCMNDVILIQKFLTNIINIIHNFSKKILKNSFSAASLSHKIFYEIYNNNKIDKNIEKKDEYYIRNSYFGGRTEVFGNPNNNEHVKYFDFSGMYGQCMLETFHNGKGKYYSNESIYKVGFHTIEYESNIDFIPVLPSHSYTGKLFFCNGKNIGTFWFEELILFEKMGGKIIKVINSYIYEQYDKVFDEFVKEFSKIRKLGGYYNVFGKLVINSLYGSMALNIENLKIYITFSEAEFLNILENVNISKFYKVNNSYIIIIKIDYKSKIYFKKKNIDEKSQRNVSYSAAIASKARIKLYQAMLDVIEDGGRLLYCDTDSIFAAYNINNKKLNFKTFNWIEFYDDAVFISPKSYGLFKNNASSIMLKGIGNKNISFIDLKQKFYNEEDITFQNQLIFKKSNFILNQNYIKKSISINKYDKRLFINNKKSTKPLWIDNSQTYSE